MPVDNPYAPPASDLAPTASPRADMRGRLLWAVGFAANLVVPGLFAAMMLSPLGWVGLVAAALTLLMLGLVALTARLAWTGTATVGGFPLAMTQLFPVLQFIVGGFAVGLAGAVTGTPSGLFTNEDDSAPPADLGPGTAFLATIIGGLVLMGFSLAVGLMIDAIWGRRSQPAKIEEIRWCE